MSTTLITTGIDQVVAEPGPNRNWTVRFRSTNLDLHHQLYLDGRLVDWTDSPGQRCFHLNGPISPAAVRVAAVPGLQRATDLSEQLPPEDRSPSWVYRPLLVRSIGYRRGDLIQILGDHATGRLSDTPLATAEAWPVSIPRWAFGEDAFGEGGFGYDGANAPGLGMGAFGAGAFGMETDLIDLEAALEEEGTHTIVLRTVGPDGQVTDADPASIDVTSPPPPAAGLRAIGYDQQAQQLTLEID